ncbi:MAG: hypothetical protein O3B31_01395 [Chloroflexi bacterium]|nr:hypothetical protein [Chloroflexota bacterium]
MTAAMPGAGDDPWPVPAIDGDDFTRTVATLGATAEAAAGDAGRGTAPELGRFAIVACFVGRFDDSARYAQILADRARAVDDAAALARAELASGIRALFLGEHTAARAYLARAIPPRTAPRHGPESYAAAVGAEVELYNGDDELAHALALATVKAAERDGDVLALTSAQLVAGLAAARLGQAIAARVSLRAAIDTAVDARDARSLMRAVEAIGLLEGDGASPALALRLLTAAGRHRRRLDLARPNELARRVALRLGELRYALGDSPFEEGAHAGQQLALNDAAALAHQSVDP